MLHWDPKDSDHEVFKEWPSFWFGELFSTQSFSARNPAKKEKSYDVPKYVQDVVDECVPYYEKLFELRLRPSSQ